MKNKLVLLFLSLALVLAILPAASAAEQPGGTLSDGIFWEFDPETGTLTISGQGEIPEYSAMFDAPWKEYRNSIYSVVVEEGITRVGMGWFSDHPMMWQAILPSTLTSIGPSAFFGCTALTDVVFPDGLKEIGASAFSRTCLSRVELPDSVTTLGNGAFSGCYGLSYVKLPAGLVRAEGSVFSECIILQEVIMPQMPDLISFGAMFFRDCDFLRDISFYTAPFIDGNMFTGCDGLTEITIPESVTALCQTDYSFAFSDCSNLTSVTFHEGVAVVGNGSFQECFSLNTVRFQGDAPEFGAAAFTDVTATCYYPADNDTWTDEVLQNYGGNLTWVPEGAAAVETSGELGSDAQWSYDPATGILTITGQGMLPDFSADHEVPWASFREDIRAAVVENGITTLGSYLFYECTNLAEVTLPDSLLGIHSCVFAGCTALKEIHLPEQLQHIGSQGFSRSGLTRLELPDLLPTLGEGAFSYCEDLVSVKLPKGLMRGWNSVFQGCASLTDITMPPEMEIQYFGYSFFSDCDALTDLSFYTLPFIDSNMFSGCDGFVDLTIPDCVTAISSNPPEPRSFAFSECSNLKTVTIPGSVKVIGRGAFSMCYALEAIYFLGDAPELAISALPAAPVKIYYPADNPTWTEELFALHSGLNFVPFSKQINPFTDVEQRNYFYEPVLWAVENGITSGTGEGKFSPKETCTRAQVVTFLWRAMGEPEPKLTENPFSDVREKDYFYKAVLWAVEKGITTGTDEGKFSPKETCTRGQVVTFLHRTLGNPAPELTENPFSDVRTKDYFHTPVLWAVEHEITTGTAADKFSPKESCTRAQVVTFLYRAMANQ